MKALIFVAIMALTGCITRPDYSNATPEQRAMALQYLAGRSAPQPYVLPTPQYHQQQNNSQYYNCVQNVGTGTPTYACQHQ